jgi:hypothetical protein
MHSPFKKYPLDLLNNCMTFACFRNSGGRNSELIFTYTIVQNEGDFCCYHKHFDGRMLVERKIK